MIDLTVRWQEQGQTMSNNSALIICQEPANSSDATFLIAELNATLLEHYPLHQIHGLHPGEEADPRLLFSVARLGEQLVGCGALRLLEPGVAEIKRMYVRPEFRGQGYSRTILAYLEKLAGAQGCTTLRLETGTHQAAALGLYRSAGYQEIPPYGEYNGSPVSLCFEKRLA